MLQGRRTTPLPIPGPELERMRTTLAPRYGAQVWEQDGSRVLVVRVPRDEPDMVRDVEEAVEVLNPGDVQGLTHALLVGEQRIHGVATQPFADLMAQRVEQDRVEAAAWRPKMAPGTHQVVRLPHDVRRLHRLVLRLRCGRVAELDDKELDGWAGELVPRFAEAPYSAVRVVHLVAAQDDVRLDADLFIQDLKTRWQESGLQARLAAELVAKQEDAKRSRQKERDSLLRDLRGRFPRIGTAPLKRMQSGEWEADSGGGEPAHAEPAAGGPLGPRRVPSPADGRSARTAGGPAAPARDPMYAEIDSLGVPFSPSAEPARPRGAPVEPEPPLEPPTAEHQGDAPSRTSSHVPRSRTADDDLGEVAGRAPAPEPEGHASPEAQDPPSEAQDHLSSPSQGGPVSPPAQLDRPDRLPARTASPIPRPDQAGPVAAPMRSSPPPQLPPAPQRPGTVPAARPSQPAAPVAPAFPPDLLRLKAHLEARGFRVLLNPGHDLDLAAERPGGDIKRVIARVMPRLGDAEAQSLLATSRALPIDLALAVAPEAEAAAKRRFIATKVRWVAPTDVDQLAL
jgi:hypothetical protein